MRASLTSAALLIALVNPGFGVAADINPEDYPALSTKQMGHVRHMINIANQLDGDFSLMGEFDPVYYMSFHAYQFQFAFAAYALASTHYHYTPAHRDLYQKASNRLIKRMIYKDVWDYWAHTSKFDLTDRTEDAFGLETMISRPLVLWMPHAPAPRREGTQTARDLYRLGRHRLYTTPFSTFETEIKEQLTEMFAEYGFDAERDIEAITVNRWSHGYTYDHLDLFDPEWEPGQAPHELGRAPIGRISIANSDSEAQAYLHAAIDAAYRAVGELKA